MGNSDIMMGKYFSDLVSSVPNIIYVILSVIAIIGGLLFLGMYKDGRGKSIFNDLLVLEYVFLLFSSTIIYRNVSENRTFNYHLFWNYANFDVHYPEVLMNIIVFIPLGFFIGLSLKRQSWYCHLGIGFCLSFCIESLQLILKRGFSELDDIIHNVFGYMIGYTFFRIVCKMKKRQSS